MSSLVSPTLQAAVDAAFDSAFSAEFPKDSILLDELSRLVSVANSVVKRHGPLIEAAIASALTETGRFEVVRNLRFPIIKTADDLVAANTPEELSRLRLKYDDEPYRTVDVDLFAIDVQNDILFAVDVKRGNGATEHRKRGPIEASLDALRLLGRSYTRQRGYRVEEVRVAVLDYYGQSGFSDRLRVDRHGVDGFFDAPVVASVETMTDYVRAKMRQRAPDLIRQLFEALAFEDGRASDLNAAAIILSDDDDMPVSPIRLPLGMPRMGRRRRTSPSAPL